MLSIVGGAAMIFRYFAGMVADRVGTPGRLYIPSQIMAIVGVLAIAAYVKGPGLGNLNLKFAQFNEPVWAVLAGILISAGMIMAPIYIGGVWSHRISTLAQSGMAVILLHALFVWFGKGHNPYLVAVVAVVVPWTLGLLLARTRWGWVFGCSRPKPLAA